MSPQNKVGQTFGRLLVIDIVSHKPTKYLCKCECGNTVIVWTSNLGRQHTESCGCLQKEVTGNINRTHGMSKTRFASIWQAMNQRCNLPNHHNYKWYGARGIKVEWTRIEDFINDMYESYVIHIEKYGVKDTTLDRIDNSKGYSKSNCKWSTMKEQCSNRRPKGSVKWKKEDEEETMAFRKPKDNGF